MRAWLTVLLALLLCTGCYNNGELATLAQSGHPGAQYEYGRRLLTGSKGLPKSPEVAVMWFAAAAEQGEHRAQAALGLCYERGVGVAMSAASAKRWYRQAALQGNSNACLAMVNMSVRRKDYEGAARWLRPLAERDVLPAQLLLGKMYLSGAAGRSKERQAVRYLRFAAMQGDPEACLLMSSCYAAGVGVPKDEQLMLGWLKNAAEAGSDRAQAMLQAAAAWDNEDEEE